MAEGKNSKKKKDTSEKVKRKEESKQPKTALAWEGNIRIGVKTYPL